MFGYINPVNYNNIGNWPALPAQPVNSYAPVMNFGYQNPGYSSNGSECIRNYAYPQIVRQNISAPCQADIPWITEPTIKSAISILKNTNFIPEDVEHMKKLGVNIIFNNGEEAVNIISMRGMRVEFGPVSNPQVHAQLQNDNNLIVINEKYKGTTNSAELLAISEAILHELGHAKDNDGYSSIQEEIDCLALNTLAFRAHSSAYPKIFDSVNKSDIIANGVALYSRLFFDPNPTKEALANRIMEKYGDLPLESPNHTASLAALVLSKKGNFN